MKSKLFENVLKESKEVFSDGKLSLEQNGRWTNLYYYGQLIAEKMPLDEGIKTYFAAHKELKDNGRLDPSKWTEDVAAIEAGHLNESKMHPSVFLKNHAIGIEASGDFMKLLNSGNTKYTDDDMVDKDVLKSVYNKLKQIYKDHDKKLKENRIVNHYQGNVKLPFTHYNGAPFNYEEITFYDGKARIAGYQGGPYAAERTYIDVYDNGSISVRDSKHGIDHTDAYDTGMIKEFVKFFKENIDVDHYNSEPTNSGLVMLSSEDTNKIRDWAQANKDNNVWDAL